jgi:hypothetical protein
MVLCAPIKRIMSLVVAPLIKRKANVNGPECHYGGELHSVKVNLVQTGFFILGFY